MTRGNVYKRGSTWSVRYDEPSPDGKRKQRSKGGFRTRRDAQQFLAEQLAAHRVGFIRAALPTHRGRVPDRRMATGRRADAAPAQPCPLSRTPSGCTSYPGSVPCGSRRSRPAT